MPREATGKIQLTPPFFLAIIHSNKVEVMSVKLALLKSGEILISDIKELIYDGDEAKNVYGYLFAEPKKVEFTAPMFLKEDSSKESSVQVSLSSWMLISKDSEFALPRDWVVTFMEPVDRLLAMYQESLDD